MRLSTTPPFVRPTAKTPASTSRTVASKTSPQDAGSTPNRAPPPQLAKTITPPPRHTKGQSQDVTADASLHKIMDEFRRGTGSQQESQTQLRRPKLLTQDSSFGQMMQAARSTSVSTQPVAVDAQMSAQERAVRRVAAKANAWWQARVGERRWLGGGRRAGPSAVAVAAAPAAAPSAAAPTAAAEL